MFKLFELFFGCRHHWQLESTVTLLDEHGNNIGRTDFCHCTKCGTPKSFTMMH